MNEGIKSSENSVFCYVSEMQFNAVQSNWPHFGKKGRETLNIDRMIWKFGFITGDKIYTSNDIQITLVHPIVSAGQRG